MEKCECRFATHPFLISRDDFETCPFSCDFIQINLFAGISANWRKQISNGIQLEFHDWKNGGIWRSNGWSAQMIAQMGERREVESCPRHWISAQRSSESAWRYRVRQYCWKVSSCHKGVELFSSSSQFEVRPISWS